jgi:hypothetical protein
VGINSSAIQTTTNQLMAALNLNTLGQESDRVLAQAGLQLRLKRTRFLKSTIRSQCNEQYKAVQNYRSFIPYCHAGVQWIFYPTHFAFLDK